MAWPNDVTKKDLTITYYRGSGPGGQNKNKRDTCCRMRHEPTGIMVTAEEGHTQGANRTYAFRRLTTILVPMMKAALKTTPPEKNPDLGTVRTYNEKRSEVRDKRLGAARYDYRRVLDGDDLGILIRDLLLNGPVPSGAPEPPDSADPAA